MKYTVVPAQVTTVEDRIAGNLSLNQLLLLITPLFTDSMLYIALPPFTKFAIYKAIPMAVILIFCGLSAIRIKDKILIQRLVTSARYNSRPKYYLYNKNSGYNRESYDHVAISQIAEDKSESKQAVHRVHLPEITLPDRERLTELLDNPAAKVSYELKKGGLYVSFTEIKD